MSGLFGFFLRATFDESWIRHQVGRMVAGLPRRTGHRLVHASTPLAWAGVSGPGILPGSLTVHDGGGGTYLLAEGECYHQDHRLGLHEQAGGPWQAIGGAWRRGGPAAVCDVDGLFTLALLETNPPRLRLVNDRYGSRRLYLLETPRAFVFAAGLGPLLAWLDPLEIDESFVRQIVCLGSPLDGRTWLSGVRLMEPATEYEVTPAGTRSTRYWRWEDLPAPRPATPADALTAAERLDLTARWDQAIGARLAGDRVGQLLSGGLDSRLILAAAARDRRRPWLAITYGESGADEVRFARSAAAAAGASWLHWRLPEPDWLETRTRFCLRHDGVIDIVNAFLASLADRLGSLLSWEVSGYLGDLVLGDTYDIRTIDEAMACLPYWSSPVALPPAAAREAVAHSIGTRAAKGWLIDTKCRRAINAWPHAAVDTLEVRKPFMDYALVELAAALPVAARARREPHRVLLAAHAALAVVPWQKTGVAPGRPPIARWAARARRVTYRAVRAGLGRVGIVWPPWVRGAVDLDAWLADPSVRIELRERLLDPRARLARWFTRQAIADTIEATLVHRQVAHEPLLHLYLVERMAADLAERRREVESAAEGVPLSGDAGGAAAGR